MLVAWKLYETAFSVIYITQEDNKLLPKLLFKLLIIIVLNHLDFFLLNYKRRFRQSPHVLKHIKTVLRFKHYTKIDVIL